MALAIGVASEHRAGACIAPKTLERSMTESSTSNWPSRLEWTLIIGAWTTVALFTAVNSVLAPRGGGSVEWSRFPMELGRELFEYAFWILLTPVVFWLARTLPLERARVVRNVVIHAVVAVGVAILVDVSDALLHSLLFPDAPAAAFNFMRIITRLWFVNELVVYIVVLAAGFARDYYLQKKERQEEAERLQARTRKLEKQLAEAQLDALRMQLNPHFLFNTLHAVSTLVGRDPQGVRRMIARLSELLRRVLDEDVPQEIPLAEELDVLSDYLEIQQIRFQGELEVSMDVPEAIQDARVPYLILQPLAENAIKHGAGQVRGTGRIRIDGQRDEEHLVLTVRDNGPGFDGADYAPGTGLQNVRARLKGLYGNEAQLHVRPVDGRTGVLATIRLPYHTGADLYAPSGDALGNDSIPEEVLLASAAEHD